jgi:hypothetical protein
MLALHCTPRLLQVVLLALSDATLAVHVSLRLPNDPTFLGFSLQPLAIIRYHS